MLSSRQLYAVIRADLLISNALFELAYVFVYVSCHIFVINAHDCLPPYIQILATPLGLSSLWWNCSARDQVQI